ncbi:esterase/lipase family protein [Corynebacterium falsenii]|uniref:esterase/lipase family protein n=1 Tax=Corynebacterium falsenii TaxID=108486 RepID=UPI003FD2CC3D
MSQHENGPEGSEATGAQVDEAVGDDPHGPTADELRADSELPAEPADLTDPGDTADLNDSYNVDDTDDADDDSEFDEYGDEDDNDRSWLAKLGSGVASTGKFIWDIPGNLGNVRLSRPQLPQLRGAIPDPPLGARQVSHGYADDLWQARPTLDRPYPVVLIHGTISSKNVWQNLVLRLRSDDFVVFCPDYGVHGTQDIPTSAQDVGAYIEQVLAATGAEQVDLVGHSQGGLLARYWINELGGEDYVHHLVTLGAPHKGTSLLGMLGNLLTTDMSQRMAAATIRRVFGEAGMQQVMGSAVLETLAASPETRPHIRYSCFATRNDSTVVPLDNAFLDDTDNPLVHNAFLQDLGMTKVKHEFLPSTPEVQQIVHETLLRGIEDDS